MLKRRNKTEKEAGIGPFLKKQVKTEGKIDRVSLTIGLHT